MAVKTGQSALNDIMTEAKRRYFPTRKPSRHLWAPPMSLRLQRVQRQIRGDNLYNVRTGAAGLYTIICIGVVTMVFKRN